MSGPEPFGAEPDNWQNFFVTAQPGESDLSQLSRIFIFMELGRSQGGVNMIPLRDDSAAGDRSSDRVASAGAGSVAG